MNYCSYKINNHVKLELKQEVSPASYFHLSSKIRQKKTSLIKILLTIITQNALLPCFMWSMQYCSWITSKVM